MLHEALDMAVRLRLIVKNPTVGTTIPKNNYPPKQILNDEQLERFMQRIRQDERWYDFFYTELTTGLRRGEICGLKWEDFDAESEKKKRLSDAELCIMYALDDGQPHSQKEICEEWLVPKTTVNTITKKWEAQGYLTLAAIPGKRREMQITLTDSGKAYAKEFMAFVYRAEDKALAKTLDKYSDTFIEALEFFGASLKEAFEEDIKNGSSQG